MTFRLELANGNGKPRFWELLCDYCEVVASFPCEQFTDFPAAFKQAVLLGWDCERNARGVIRYSCPSCAPPSEQHLG